MLPLHLSDLLLLLLHDFGQLQLHLIRKARIALLHGKLVLIVAAGRFLLWSLRERGLVHVQEPDTRLLSRIILVLERDGPVN
jgi:hypothetical protein